MKYISSTLILCNMPSHKLKTKVSDGKVMCFVSICVIYSNIFLLINTLDPSQG